MPQFVHLHVHTQYSVLDGAASISGIIKQAKKYGMPAVAITDHGNMFGAMEMYEVAKREGIKPILGCETYIVKNRLEKKKETEKRFHLILLAKNEKGYHNLIKLVSMGFLEGSYYGKARIDHTILEQYHEGLICCSACIAGEVSRAILNNDFSEADRVIEWYKGIFGEDYYLEMQCHKTNDMSRPQDVWANQQIINKGVIELAKKHNVKVIATNDVHFVDADYKIAHDLLLCINTGRDLDDPNRMMYTGEEYFKSAEEMEELFADYPEALANTVEIADKVEAYSLEHEPLMPIFTIPEDFEIDEKMLRLSLLSKIKDDQTKSEIENTTSIYEYVERHPELSDNLIVAKQFQYLTYLVYVGAKERYGELSEQLVERFDFELKTIEWMGYPGYFLIVWDYIKVAREMGVSVGPGRGSAAGSVVSYALKITNIDPLKYNLLFERFLNPDRISLPDVDIDFDEDGRADVMNYVIAKYGREKVAQIITFGTMAPKGAIRDVARVQKLPLSESDRLAKLVPDKLVPRKGESAFECAYRESPELAAAKNSENPLIRDTLKYAEQLEGSIRQTGVHACGVIIGRESLEQFVPVAIAKDADLNVVQFDGKYVENIGLIKMDFLGLKTLSIIKDALENIKRVKGIEIDIDNIPLDDKKTYELFSGGETTGVFQFESAGMKKHMRALKPTRFEDLIAMNALYRPGPMDKIPAFIARKHGKEAVSYEFPEMEKYLADTYGITVYQEQVMLLSQLLAGFTGGQADTLRKAMGKKQRSILDKMKPQFLEGAVSRGHDIPTCEKIWTDWEAFASYAFNKSHATCYAYVAYQTAYLKANYPAEFMAAVLSRNLSNIEKLIAFMEECRRTNINVLGVDINESIGTFSADKKGNIRFGMMGVKGVGENAVKDIIKEREENGMFVDIYDFVERVNLQNVNRKSVDNLALAGCFDSIFGANRSKLFVTDERDNAVQLIDQIMRYGNKFQAEKNNMQQSLFGGQAEGNMQRPSIPHSLPDWSKLVTLKKEYEVTGMYLSGHPLDDFATIIKSLCNTTVTQFDNLGELKGKDFISAGIIQSVTPLATKEGKPYCRFVLEDYTGSHEFLLFSRDYEMFRPYIYPEYFLMVRGSVRNRFGKEDEFEAKFSGFTHLSEVQENLKNFMITLYAEDITPDFVAAFNQELKGSKGKATLKVRIVDSQSGVSLGFYAKGSSIKITKKLMDFCDNRMIRYTIS